MKLLLVLFLALFALVGAAPRAAAGAGCDMSGMDMSEMAPAQVGEGAGDPCCDHQAKDCPAACNAVCAITATVVETDPCSEAAVYPVVAAPPRHAPLRSIRRDQVDPPPKSLT